MAVSLPEENFKDPVKPKLNSLLIESVENGFIVYENEIRDHLRSPSAEIRKRQVFNTKDQLNKFINDNM